MMNLKSISTYVALAAGGVLALTSAPAQAFSFTTNLGPGSNAPKGNIFLDSVVLSGGQVVSDFVYVDEVAPFTYVNPGQTTSGLFNQKWTGGANSGSGSSDKGDHADGVRAENPTPAQMAASLGNNNLNNIIDTEDTGSFRLNVFFEKAVDTLFFWERGMNSRLGVHAIDKDGNLLGNQIILDSSTWASAGYSIDTMEISGSNAPQRVGSFGLFAKDLGIEGSFAGLQLTSMRSYNGPDFKVVGASTAVPEPATIAGLGLVAGAMAAARRRKVAKQA